MAGLSLPYLMDGLVLSHVSTKPTTMCSSMNGGYLIVLRPLPNSL
uniref:Uncharacterized protein n=1 Tax=Picea glauca TaxID=3330 RepID=A0A101LYX1_PICGL|nr:hypothetical protein ABT39_MTgene4884 [Picea glauca]QHR92353.1 hypothetical protein Q903MT_gene6395 [Picea sitchensis]